MSPTDFPVYRCSSCGAQALYTGCCERSYTTGARYHYTLIYRCASDHVMEVQSTPKTDPLYHQRTHVRPTTPPPFPGRQ